MNFILWPFIDLNQSKPATINSTFCLSKGCIWDGTASNVRCYLPLDGSASYGYEVRGNFSRYIFINFNWLVFNNVAHIDTDEYLIRVKSWLEASPTDRRSTAAQPLRWRRGRDHVRSCLPHRPNIELCCTYYLLNFNNCFFLVYWDFYCVLQFYPKGTDKTSYRPPVKITIPSDPIVAPLYTVRLASNVIGQPFDFQIVRRSSNVVM